MTVRCTFSSLQARNVSFLNRSWVSHQNECFMRTPQCREVQAIPASAEELQQSTPAAPPPPPAALPPQLSSDSASLPARTGAATLSSSLSKETAFSRNPFSEHVGLFCPVLVPLGSSVWPGEQLQLSHPRSSLHTGEASPGPVDSHCTALPA